VARRGGERDPHTAIVDAADTVGGGDAGNEAARQNEEPPRAA
jgi:hypothetical protein